MPSRSPRMSQLQLMTSYPLSSTLFWRAIPHAFSPISSISPASATQADWWPERMATISPIWYVFDFWYYGEPWRYLFQRCDRSLTSPWPVNAPKLSIADDACWVSQGTCEQACKLPASLNFTRDWYSYRKLVGMLRFLLLLTIILRVLRIRAICLGRFRPWISQILDFDSFMKTLKIYF